MSGELKAWFHSGAPWVWLSASAVTLSVVMVAGLLGLIAVRGLGHFWPAPVLELQVLDTDGSMMRVIGESYDAEDVPASRLREAWVAVASDAEIVRRYLIKTGNRDLAGLDFRWIAEPNIRSRHYPEDVLVVERREWGNVYGYLRTVMQDAAVVAQGAQTVKELQRRLERAHRLYEEVRTIEKNDIDGINYALERERLKARRLELDGDSDPVAQAAIEARRAELKHRYQRLQVRLAERYKAIERDSFSVEVMDGQVIQVPIAQVIRVYQPNAMHWGEKMGFYLEKAWEFVSAEPREANTEGGIFPAIFGTVLMVILMAVLVTPLGVIAAVYLHEYAKQGPLTRTIRIAVNNLAGVPSIVYGVFGLGFFVYVVGGNIDQWFFPEALPAPTFGTPGILWASLTLALLTLPVVIVATEEGLVRVPKSLREGSLALGATQAETLWRVVLPIASPAMMTGLILAIARAAGEVAPLMLVGVVKLAPSLPIDGNAPYLHLERKFMHLGFHIYDVGFQSPNVEAARPLVFATALLLVAVILLLNLAAIMMRNHLRERYRALES